MKRTRLIELIDGFADEIYVEYQHVLRSVEEHQKHNSEKKKIDELIGRSCLLGDQLLELEELKKMANVSLEDDGGKEVSAFDELVEKISTDEKYREKVGTEMELLATAADRAFERLGQLHEYDVGSPRVDVPFLNHKTVKNLEGEKNEED